MKKVYLPIIFVFIALFAGAQTFQVKILDTDTIVSNNDTLYAFGTSEDFDVKKHFVIENQLSETLNMNVARQDVDLPEGMSSVFCLNVCYPPNTREVDFTLDGDGSQNLDVDVWIFENSGVALVKIILTNVDASETLTFYVKYYVNAVGIFDANINELNAYPNPVTSTMNVIFNGSTNPDTKIDIYDAVGKLVISQPITSAANYQLNLSDLPRGIYMLKLVDNSKVIQSKKIIKQ
jgi:hypothetical protein